jgi:hypothetical protein
VINFRYVHDFMYGFDWARWVSHEPETRQGIGPFDKIYLYHVEERRGELVEFIAEHDAQFGLAADGVHHNPFSFSREPADERRLHEALAGDNLIPVQAWRFDGTRGWAQPYTQIREQYAQKLGIPSNSSPPVLIVTMIPFGCMAPRSKGRCPLPDVYRIIAQ